jgi:hypothetical protein
MCIADTSFAYLDSIIDYNIWTKDELGAQFARFLFSLKPSLLSFLLPTREEMALNNRWVRSESCSVLAGAVLDRYQGGLVAVYLPGWRLRETGKQ